jgi:hypothetical protein
MSLKEKVSELLKEFPIVKVGWRYHPESCYYPLGKVNEWKEKLRAVLEESQSKKPTPFTASLYDVHACELLMRALNEVDANVSQFWFDPVITMLSYFDLPNKECSECHKEMSFFDYHIRQGMCGECASKISQGDYVE